MATMAYEFVSVEKTPTLGRHDLCQSKVLGAGGVYGGVNLLIRIFELCAYSHDCGLCWEVLGKVTCKRQYGFEAVRSKLWSQMLCRMIAIVQKDVL